MSKSQRGLRSFYRWSLGALIFCLLIILWGAFVRLSGSGDGCGTSWPLCQGYLVPTGDFLLSLQTWIEYFHRLKSGLFGLLILALWIASFRLYARGSWVRQSAHFVLIFTLAEALIGAGLVVFGWVNQDQSLARVVVGGFHLVNTFSLLAALLALCFFSKRSLEESLRSSEEVTAQKHQLGIFMVREPKLCVASFVSFLMICVFGFWASLSSQLYPVETLMEGLKADFDPESPFVVRWRIFHPLAAFGGLGVIGLWYSRLSPEVLSFRFLNFFWIFVGALCFGVATWFLMAPLWMKLAHLLIADALWLLIVLAFLQDSFRKQQMIPVSFAKTQFEKKNLSPAACSF